MGMKNKHNCYGCEDRYVGCHAECESYMAFTKERNEMLDEKNKEVRRIDICSEFICGNILKMEKRRRR